MSEIRIDGDVSLLTEIDGDVGLNTEIGGEVGAFMPIQPRLQSKTVTPSESAQTVTADEGYNGLSEVSVGAVSSTYVGSDIPVDQDLTVTGNTVSVPAGYYSENTSATVPAVALADPTASIVVNTGEVIASITQSTGYVTGATKTATYQLSTVAGTTITPTESVQLAVDKRKWTLGQVKVGAIPSNYVGSAISEIDADDLTVSGKTVTVPAGYVAETLTKDVADGSVIMPLKIITANPTISVDSGGLITSSVSDSGSLHPAVSAGYVSSVSDGAYSVSGSATSQLTTAAGATITPTESTQTAISANTYALGDIKVGPIPSNYVVTTDADAVAADIRSGKTAYVNGSKITGTKTFSPWGDDWELVKEFTDITGNLKDDTTFNSWTASTTAGTLLSGPTFGTFTATDLTQYEYVILYDCGLCLKYNAGATLKVMPHTYSFIYTVLIHRHPTSLTGWRGNTWTTNSYSGTSNYYLAYYKSDGTETIAATTYGVYFTSTAPTLSSTSSASPTITVKSPNVVARCSTTYFATARKTEIDSENSKFFSRARVYRVNKGAYQTAVWHRMVDAFNEAEDL